MKCQFRWFDYLLVGWFIVVYVFYFRQFAGLAKETVNAIFGIL